ncbi:MAG: c-type cytochrome [Gaiellaceae bacterium]
MSNNEIIISVVTAVLVVFSLVVSVVIPKRDPNFPGRRNLVTFGLICMVLIGGTLAAIEVYGAEEGHGAEAAVGEGEPGAEEEGTTPAAEEPPPGEGPPAEGPPPAGAPGDAEAGAGVFVAAGCASCHVLADAGATGTIGPNLDESLPSFEVTVDRVTNGAGAMPAFADQLSGTEIEDVAAYVVAAASC